MIVIGRINDVMLYRELVRRGVSDYVIAPVSAIDVVRWLERKDLPGFRLIPAAEPVPVRRAA